MQRKTTFNPRLSHNTHLIEWGELNFICRKRQSYQISCDIFIKFSATWLNAHKYYDGLNK